MSRFLWLLPLLSACTGLYLDKGNSYPCDFSQGPDVRDSVCQPGDVCGIDNVCQSFIYEGPRFEGKATLPEYGPDSDEGEVLHPLVLEHEVQKLVADLPLERGLKGYVTSDAGLFSVSTGHVGAMTPPFPSNFPAIFGKPVNIQPFFNTAPGPGSPTSVAVQSDLGFLAIGTLEVPMVDVIRTDGGARLPVKRFRIIDLPGLPPRAFPVAWSETQLGGLARRLGEWEFVPWINEPGKVLDIAGLTVPGRLWTLVLLPEEIDVLEVSDGGVSVAAVVDTLSVDEGQLKTDPGNRIVAAWRRGSLPPVPAQFDVLSTFQVNINSEGPTLTSPWPDCTPCPNQQHIEMIAPSVRSGSPTVDVVCMREVGSMNVGLPVAMRVVGSVALTQFGQCLTEELDMPVPPARFAGPPDNSIAQWNNQSGLLVGGKHGELWSGETLTSLSPEFLDRVPLDVAPANAGTTPSIAVITDDYLAVQQTSENQLDEPEQREQLNGFRKVSARELGAGEDLRMTGFVHGVGGWAVANGGVLTRLKVGKGAAVLEAGSQLVTSSEDSIRSSIGGEAFVDTDGGVTAFFIAADDSLYFVEAPASTLLPANDGLLELPDLTPEPSVPIRSLALERTRLGTNGKDKAAGYLVTSRNVFSWELSGTPPRWSARPLLLTSGEPVEVWFDSPRSALGRVGYRDGQIFSLPGGYLLAQALPAGPDGTPAQVLDFENLGGWPVAYANTGLFIAGWDQEDGKLQNRFASGVNKPMTWREVKLAGDATPWMRNPVAGSVRPRAAKAGKLFVAIDPPAAGFQQHRLLLFNDDEVRQVARHLRVSK